MSLNSRIDRLMRLIPPDEPEPCEAVTRLCELIGNPVALAEYVVHSGDEIPANIVAAIRAIHPDEIEMATTKFRGRSHESNGPDKSD
jgi:hypothetical protein